MSGNYKNNPSLNEDSNKMAQQSIKSKLQDNGSKFMSATISKNFFNSHETEDYEYMIKQQPNQPQNQVQARNQIKSRKPRGKKHQKIVLQPMKQPKNIQVYENINKNDKVSTSERIIDNAQKQESTITNLQRKEEIKKRAEQRRTTKKKVEQVSLDNQKMQSQQQKKQAYVQIAKFKSNIDLFFEESQEETVEKKQDKIEQKTKEHLQTKEIIDLAERNKTNSQIFIDSEQDAQGIINNGQSPKDDAISTGSEYFNFTNRQAYRKQLFLNVRQKTVLHMEILRDNSGFNSFWPQFHLHFNQDSRYVMSAKKTSSKPTSTFIITSSKHNFEINTQFYLGKIKSNLLGDVMNIFGPGLSPSDAKQSCLVPRELLASIVFESSLFQMGKPRQFYVYIKKPAFNYYKDFEGVKLYEQQIPLHELFKANANKDKIMILHNRKPIWMANINHYMLDFKGRVQKASIKNFILEEEENGKDFLLFGRVNELKFNVDVYSNLSTFLGFAIALSSFDSRFMCE